MHTSSEPREPALSEAYRGTYEENEAKHHGMARRQSLHIPSAPSEEVDRPFSSGLKGIWVSETPARAARCHPRGGWDPCSSAPATKARPLGPRPLDLGVTRPCLLLVPHIPKASVLYHSPRAEIFALALRAQAIFAHQHLRSRSMPHLIACLDF